MVYTSEKCICMLDANVANTHRSRVTGPVLVVRVISKHGSTPRVGPSKRRYINSGRVRNFTLLISRFFQHAFAAIMRWLSLRLSLYLGYFSVRLRLPPRALHIGGTATKLTHYCRTLFRRIRRPSDEGAHHERNLKANCSGRHQKSVISAFGFGCLLEPCTLGGPRRN
jgi:hypothetical protein